MEHPDIPNEFFEYWLSRLVFRNIESPEYKKMIADIFIKSIYVLDDGLKSGLNFSDGMATIPRHQRDSAQGSDSLGYAPPPHHPVSSEPDDDFLYPIFQITLPMKGCVFILRIIFVRHGHPNYRKDCLTELGHEHAAADAQRLKDEGICEVHSSSCGRAVETAQYTANLLGLPVIQHDFMREIGWGSVDGSELFENGHPWLTTDDMILRGENLMRVDWRETDRFRNNKVVQFVDNVAVCIDQWLETLGYTREGSLYRVTGSNTDRTIAMFSHAGSSSAAMSHMFNLPFPYFCKAMEMNLTSISIVHLLDTPNELVLPRFEIANDSRHIQSCERLISN